MERGSGVATANATDSTVTDACSTHLAGATMMDIRQTRKGFCQEILGCEAKTEFKYFNAEKAQVAHSIEDTDCLCRMCCPYVVVVVVVVVTEYCCCFAIECVYCKL